MSNANNALLASPMAQWLGLSVEEDGVYRLAFHDRHIGNPAIRAIHGGVVAAFLECAAQHALMVQTGAAAAPGAVNMDIDYLQSSRAQDMRARIRILRLGRRVAFVEAVAWQDEEAEPVAIAHFRLRPGR